MKGNSLYLAAGILITIWAIAFIGFGSGAIIHVLLILAFVAIIQRIMEGRKPG